MRALSFLLLLTPFAAAQNIYVQPIGYDGVEGNSSTGIPFSYLSARVQQADSNRIGLPMGAISSLTFRRDRTAGATAVARTVDVTVLMGKCDINAFTSTFANNWLAAPTTVYATKPTNVPDLSMAPPAPPGPFVVPIVLDVPFSYDGVDSLLWEMTVDNGVTGTYSLDWVSAATTTSGATSTALGTGCTTPNGAMALTTTFSADAVNLNLSFNTTRAPASAPLTLLLGFLDPNLTIPGLCAALHSEGTVNAPIGTASATGALTAGFPIPWSPLFSGVTLYSQVFGPDLSQAGLPIALSNGRMSPLPLTSGGPAPTGYRRTFSTTSSTAVTGSAPSTSAVVTQIIY
ncbi:MAG: hypothetical protein IPM29_09430 [Planctomycetes bacterium]|nr:hypothetical protein [Planctomycetota bacterium]